MTASFPLKGTFTDAIDPTLVRPNKFQPTTRLTFTDADLADLESIKDRGLDYPIKVFAQDGYFIVKDGWRRTSAWMRWETGKPIPASIEPAPANDKELFLTSVVTNENRENLNVIQKAELLAQAIALGMTQAEAGRLFNPPITQTAVSHILSLRKLPDEIKAHVEKGDVSERAARPLVTLATHSEVGAIQAAHKIANAKPQDKDMITRQATSEAYGKAGQSIYEWHSYYKWPAKETDVSGEAKPDKGEPTIIATCVDCPFNVEFNASHYCMRPACFGLKTRLMAGEQTKKAEQAKITKRTTGRGAAKNQAAPNPTAEKAREDKAKAKREADLAECRRLIAAALDALVEQMPQLPEPYRTLVAANWTDFTIFKDDDVPKWLANLNKLSDVITKLKPAEKQRLVAGATIAGRLNDHNMTPASVTKAAEATAKEWKLKLPKNWNIAPNTATPSPKEKKGYGK